VSVIIGWDIGRASAQTSLVTLPRLLAKSQQVVRRNVRQSRVGIDALRASLFIEITPE